MRDGRFKTRSQLYNQRRQMGAEHITSAAGGGTDKAISLTTDARIAEAVCVGLNVFRLIAANTDRS